MSKCVLDASALLALLNGEPGVEKVAAAVGDAAVCAVNLAEAYRKLVSRGMPPEPAREALAGLALDIVPFDEEMAYVTGALRTATDKLGLSLGDRACLATAKQLKLPAYTADREWLKLKMPTVKVVCIR